MGVLLQAFFFGPGQVHGVPSPADGDRTIPFWWDHLASQAQTLRQSGFSAIWLPPPQKGASGTFSNGYDVFDDYDLGSKDQKGTIPTRYGSREQLERCVAMMRANGIDVYVDLVENQRDGDDGRFNFEYVDAFGRPGKGRFPKGPLDFHPNVPQDPGVFDDRFSFGRDLAPINGKPPHYVFQGLIDAGNWLTRALDIQGYRLDDVKGVSTYFMLPLLNQGAMAGKFAVAEFFDTNIPYTQSWMNAMQYRSSVFDFSLRFTLSDMCNNPGSFNMSDLDHAGMTGIDPMGSVTFVENHDTDQNFPIVQNKLLAYAYILTAEGYPCVFYRDYSTDRNCFGLKPEIDRLIWIHEHLADGPTVQRWKDLGVFAFERLGGRHLLVGLNKDPNTSRSIFVQTGFPPHTQLHDFAGHETPVTTDAHSNVGINIPTNRNGDGYVCYAPPTPVVPFRINSLSVTQEYEGASDLDIRPATSNEAVNVCRVFAEAHQTMEARLLFDASKWTPVTSIQLDILDPSGSKVASRTYHKTTVQDTPLTFEPQAKGFHTFRVQSGNTPADDSAPAYKLRVTYRAPQTL